MARTVGIIRRLDDLGRITLPKEYRTYLGIKPTDKVEMILDEEGIRVVPVKESKSKKRSK